MSVDGCRGHLSIWKRLDWTRTATRCRAGRLIVGRIVRVPTSRFITSQLESGAFCLSFASPSRAEQAGITGPFFVASNLFGSKATVRSAKHRGEGPRRAENGSRARGEVQRAGRSGLQKVGTRNDLEPIDPRGRATGLRLSRYCVPDLASVRRFPLAIAPRTAVGPGDGPRTKDRILHGRCRTHAHEYPP